MDAKAVDFNFAFENMSSASAQSQVPELAGDPRAEGNSGCPKTKLGIVTLSA